MRKKKFKLGVAEVLHLRRVWTAVWAACGPKLNRLTLRIDRTFPEGREKARRNPRLFAPAMFARATGTDRRQARNQHRTGRLATFAGSPHAARCVGCRHDRDCCREAGACRGIVVRGVTRTRHAPHHDASASAGLATAVAIMTAANAPGSMR